jgi:16S rRNA (cytosine1402-N4)-methyltransferase
VDSATRTFQAIRIAVNDEISELQALLAGVLDLLGPGGVFVCLTYHSLEDRLVKRAMRESARSGRGELVTKKPLVPGRDEVRENRRARSAKLRALRRPGPGGAR